MGKSITQDMACRSRRSHSHPNQHTEADRNYSEDHMVLIDEAKKELNTGTRVPVKQ